MNEITVKRRVNASQERVWAVITDLEASPEVVSSIDAVEIVDGDGFGVGTVWNETRTMLGKAVTEQMEVTAMDAPSSYVVESDSRGTHYVSRFDVVADGDGAVLTMSFRGEPTTTSARVLGSALGWLVASPTRKAIQRDLDDIASTAEADSAGAPPAPEG